MREVCRFVPYNRNSIDGDERKHSFIKRDSFFSMGGHNCMLSFKFTVGVELTMFKFWVWVLENSRNLKISLKKNDK